MPSSVRLNVTVPKDVAETLKEEAGARGQSAFIAESVRFYAKRLKRKRLMEALKEGYLATAKEGTELSKEFDDSLTDGFDEDY